MSWTDITRAEHKRICSRYPSDCTDEEWAIIEPLLPAARLGGRPRTTDMRNLFDAILYMAQGGIQWRIESSTAWILIAHIRILIRRIARLCNQT